MRCCKCKRDNLIYESSNGKYRTYRCLDCGATHDYTVNQVARLLKVQDAQRKMEARNNLIITCLLITVGIMLAFLTAYLVNNLSLEAWYLIPLAMLTTGSSFVLILWGSSNVSRYVKMYKEFNKRNT